MPGGDIMLPIYEIRKTDLTVKHNNYELTFPEHIHKYIEIIYVFKGSQDVTIEGVSYKVTEGSAAVIFPETLHSYSGTDKKYTADTAIVMCAPKLFGKLFPDISDYRTESPVITADKINSGLETAFSAIVQDNDFTVRFSWTCVIISYILQIMKPIRREGSLGADITYRLVKYIEENFTQDITRASLARTFGISECYVSKIFAQKFKINLRGYLGLLRSEYAAGLIRTTDETFTAISQAAGFNSLRTFNRMFRIAYGTSPKDYRDNISRIAGSE